MAGFFLSILLRRPALNRQAHTVQDEPRAAFSNQEKMMFRTASTAVLALGLLALGVLPTPAHAMDCQKEFRVRVDRMMAKRDIRVPTLDMINTTRFLLQGYDACMSGDMASAKSYFERMARRGQ